MDVDSSNDDSTPNANSIIRLSIIKVNKLDTYSRERNSLED